MKVTVELFGALKSPFGRTFELEMEENTTIGEVLKKDLKYEDKDIRYLVFLINDQVVSIDRVLKDKDSLRILLPMGGG